MENYAKYLSGGSVIVFKMESYSYELTSSDEGSEK